MSSRGVACSGNDARSRDGHGVDLLCSGPMPAPRPHPRRAARLELARALLGVAGLPLRLGWFALTRRRWKRRLAVHLNDPAPVLEAPPLPAHVSFPDRPLRFCLSCGETSSAGHAARVAEALRETIVDEVNGRHGADAANGL